MNKSPAATHTRTPAVAFIFITVALDMLALGMIIPVLPQLVTHFVGGDAARGAEIFGLFGSVWALMQFVAAPIMGGLSDRFGRRPVILISNFGLGLDYIFMALAPSLGWLLVGRIISGITAASISTSTAYIADVTEPAERAAKFGLIGAAFGLGFILGPALGGLCGGIDPHLPFWVAAVLSLLNGFYGLFVLPESLTPANRIAFSWRKANPLGSLRLLRSQPQLLGLAMVGFFSQLGHVVLPSTFVLYAAYRYAWGGPQVGLTLAAVGVCSMLVQAGLIRPLVAYLGERRALLLGLLCGAIAFAIYGAAATGGLFLLGIPVMALWGLANASLQALMSARVGPSQQGSLQGANGSLNSLAQLFGPPLFTLTFAHFIGTGSAWKLPGAPFLLASLLLMVALVFAVQVAHTRSPSTD